MPTLPTPTLAPDQQLAAVRASAGARVLDDELIVVRGEDRAAWLAGMVTQDTKALAVGASKYTAIVHVKGKLLADAWVFARADDYVLAVPQGTAAGLLEHFARYIIMEDVELERLAGVALVAVVGPRAREFAGEGAFAYDPIGRGGVARLVESDALLAPIVAAIASGELASIDAPTWDVARLESGLPRWGVDFGPENYVQEAAITSRAVSFHKGCYIGQEVVCRLEMRGHVRRQLVALVLDDAGEPPARGTRVGGELGEVTSSARSPSLGRAVALAMIKWDAAQPGHALDVAGRAATQVERPVP